MGGSERKKMKSKAAKGKEITHELEFDVEDDWHIYEPKIEGWRHLVADGSEIVQVDGKEIARLVLPKQLKNPIQFVRIKLKTRTKSITLELRRDNLYLVGYQDMNGEWFAFSDMIEYAETGASDLFFGSSYISMQNKSTNRSNIPLGHHQIVNAVNYLAGSDEKKDIKIGKKAIGQKQIDMGIKGRRDSKVSENDQTGEKARQLIVIVETICEPMRFDAILGVLAVEVGGVYRCRETTAIPAWMIQLQNNWSPYCDTIHKYIVSSQQNKKKPDSLKKLQVKENSECFLPTEEELERLREVLATVSLLLNRRTDHDVLGNE